MIIKLKFLGIITRLNGIDATQTRDYIKTSNTTYFRKTINNKHHLSYPPYAHLISINSDPAYNQKLKKLFPSLMSNVSKSRKNSAAIFRPSVR